MKQLMTIFALFAGFQAHAAPKYYTVTSSVLAAKGSIQLRFEDGRSANLTCVENEEGPKPKIMFGGDGVREFNANQYSLQVQDNEVLDMESPLRTSDMDQCASAMQTLANFFAKHQRSFIKVYRGVSGDFGLKFRHDLKLDLAIDEMMRR